MDGVGRGAELIGRVEPVLQELSGRRLSLRQTIEAVGSIVGRHIEIVEWLPLARSKTTGAWLAFNEHDEILVAPSGSWVHHCQIVLHELAHMLMVHAGIEPLGETITFQVPGRAVGKLRACRGMRAAAVELAAEHIADRLLVSSAVPDGAETFAKEFG